MVEYKIYDNDEDNDGAVIYGQAKDIKSMMLRLAGEEIERNTIGDLVIVVEKWVL